MKKKKDPENWKRRCPYCDKKVAGVNHDNNFYADGRWIRLHVKKFHKRKYKIDNWNG